MDPAIVGFGAPSAEGEAKTQACAIRAALLERPEQCVAVSSRETPAFVPRRAMSAATKAIRIDESRDFLAS